MDAKVWWVPILVLAAVATYVVVRPAPAPAPTPAPAAPRAVDAAVAPPSAAASVDYRAARRAVAVKAPGERPGEAPAVKRPARMAPEDIHHAATGASPLVYQCYQQRVAAGAHPKGLLKLSFTLVKKGGYGELTALSVADESVGDPALMECIRKATVEAFPVMGEDAEIELTIPFTLPPPDAVEGSAP